jgi:transcriptional regulator with GAF, ATPase, and Fis domain
MTDRVLRITRELLAEADLDAAARLLLTRMVELTGAARGFIVVRDDDGYADRFDVDFDREAVSAMERRFSRALVRRAIETRALLYAPSAVDDPQFAGIDSVVAIGRRAVLVAPLCEGAGVHGVVYLDGSSPIDDGSRTAVAQLSELAAPLLRRALAEDALRRRARMLESGLLSQFDFGGIITGDPRMRALLGTVAQIAEASATVLVRGETGTGKELIARALHVNSTRRARPFTALHCAALPASVLESELFGYAKGAFTGADRDRAGRIAATRGGTLLIDELGEIPPAIQAKLLRFLQSGEIQRLGSDRTEKVDVRVVCATHRDLAQLVKEGQFRQDLYYRVRVVELEIPPLRQRIGDCELLIDRFMKRLAPGKKLTEAARAILLGHDYPGNVRELEYLIERIALLGNGPELGAELLPEDLQRAAASGSTGFMAYSNAELHAQRKAAVAQVERTFIAGLLQKSAGNISAAARIAGMPRGYLQKLIARGKRRPP